MTKKELWKIYSKRNPSFDSEKGNVTLSAAGLRKLFETTWEVAMYDGEEEPSSKHPPSGNLDALKQIFGMK
jgi:hypothetical protein